MVTLRPEAHANKTLKKTLHRPITSARPDLGLGYHELSGPVKMHIHTSHALIRNVVVIAKCFTLGFVVQSCLYDSMILFVGLSSSPNCF